MDFWQAVSSGFRNYVNFSGRAVRSEYWYWGLFVAIVTVAARVADYAIFGSNRFGPFRIIWDVATLLPSIALAVRRLHDTDRSGWWFAAIMGPVVLVGVLTFPFHVLFHVLFLLLFAIVLSVGILVYLFCQPGTAGPNSYGPDPFGPGGHISPRPAV
ncbi:MAG TPA: DUF805 domain-containing protein [Xanthobacteraceae bacterium]|jgi:uncharacterized membrane protein YhaH (DUF805 family)|nr:DUF805 domain-containing protein [Xanthobacteraceae bacterium]